MSDGSEFMNKRCTWGQDIRVFLRDVGRGLFIITHSSLAMVGLAALGLVLTLWL
jgi:hypothetical protein